MIRHLILSLLLSSSAFANESPAASEEHLSSEETEQSFADDVLEIVTPDYVYGQNGAYAGFAVAGLGYKLSDYWAWDLNYGYTPESIAGHDIHSFSGKIFGYFAKIGPAHEWELKPYLGLGFVYSPDPELFVRLPNQYPDWYYPPTAIRAGFYGGFELELKKPGVALFSEFAVLDHEIPTVVNRGKLKTRDVGSLGFGVRWNLDP